MKDCGRYRAITPTLQLISTSNTPTLQHANTLALQYTNIPTY